MTVPAANSTMAEIEQRLLGLQPKTFDSEERSVTAVISRGSPVARYYGTETLRISTAAINLKRVHENHVPILDSHQQIGLDKALGVVRSAWVENDKQGPALVGKLSFNDTWEGRRAEGMIMRGELTGISIGYRVEEWEIKADGRVIDPAVDRDGWRDENLEFEGVRWELLELSLVNVPADSGVGFRFDRAFEPGGISRAQAALARQRMRMSAAGIDRDRAGGLSASDAAIMRMIMRQTLIEHGYV